MRNRGFDAHPGAFDQARRQRERVPAVPLDRAARECLRQDFFGWRS